MKKSVAQICVLAFVSIFLTACGPKYGSDTITTAVSAIPNRAEIYLIPTSVWNNHGGESMVYDAIKNIQMSQKTEDEKAELYKYLRKFRVGKTPIDAHPKVDKDYIFVATRGEQFEWVRKTTARSLKTLELDLSS